MGGDEVGREGKGGELGLEGGEAGDGGVEGRKTELGGGTETESKGDAVEAEESLTAVGEVGVGG